MPRSGVLAALTAGVLALHLWLAEGLATQQAAWQEASLGSAMARLKADFVAELRPSAAPPAAPRAPARSRARRANAAIAAPAASAASAAAHSAAASATSAASAASTLAASEAPAMPAEAAVGEEALLVAAAPLPAEPLVEPPAEPLAEPQVEPVQASALPSPEPPAQPVPPAPEPAPALEWPRSTRLDYRLSGNYRGPVDGQASVQWLLDGVHYQVHVEVGIGPSFAPLVWRRTSSDGLIGDDGLRPRHYEEETRTVLRTPRRLAIELGEERVRLSDGSERPRPPGLQDSASQFVHLTWLFTTQPQRLRSGQSVPVPLALPRSIDTWVYDVLGEEELATGAGPLATVHLRPRRPERPGSDLSAEVWIAPSLQYLPVRILIRQDAETFVDLLLSRLPRQAADMAAR